MQVYLKKTNSRNISGWLFVLILTITYFDCTLINVYGNELAYPHYSFALSDPDGLEEEFMLFQKTQYVHIASKIEEDINKAPSIVTVITAKEIENMGARTITDILRTVPGFDIIKDAAIGFVEVGTRGVQRSSEGIKVHIDGHSINSPLDGQAFVFFDDLSLKNVKRIEVIRGPGSALYGANAFRAVINIITKDASDIDGIEASVGFGSYDSQEYSIMFGKEFYGLEIAGFAEFYNTNGISETIKEDALFASPFLNLFAITPGDTDDSRKKADLNMKLSYKDVKLNAKYMNKDTEPFVGTAFVLTNDSKQQFNGPLPLLLIAFSCF